MCAQLLLSKGKGKMMTNEVSHMRQIGVVETLRQRIYPRYEDSGVGFADDTVIVDPGVWPLFYNEHAGTIHWVMDGFVNDPFEEIDRTEDSALFIMHGGDYANRNKPVTIDSPKFSVVDFSELRIDEVAQPGPSQRLRIILGDGVELAAL